MAHDQATRQKARSLYVYKHLNYEDISRDIKVPAKTIMRWKKKAEKFGDDWDKARHINGLSEQNASVINRQVYAEWLTRFQTVQTSILSDEKMDTVTRVAALASLADSFNKMIAAMRKIEPEANLASTALTVLETVIEYLREVDEALARKFGEHIDAIGLRIQQKFVG